LTPDATLSKLLPFHFFETECEKMVIIAGLLFEISLGFEAGALLKLEAPQLPVSATDDSMMAHDAFVL
jgi:hypothetical protein